MTNLEVGDVVLCTVDRIAGTIVFVKIHSNGEQEGSIILSEIAPGRIRNLRDYVVPKKKIVCKILRISGNQIDLSLRRVTQKEKKQVLDQHKQEKSYISVLKTVLNEKAQDIIKKIKPEESVYDFLEEAKENSKKLEKLVGKTDSKKILDILKIQKQKKAIIKKELHITTTKSNGLELIKNLLNSVKESSTEIKYISAGKYSIKTESTGLKTADNKLREIIEGLKKQAKKQDMEFEIKEGKRK